MAAPIVVYGSPLLIKSGAFTPNSPRLQRGLMRKAILSLGTVPFSVSGVWVFLCSLHILFWLKLLSNLKLLLG